MPVLRMPGASARYSCLRAPVETVTPPDLTSTRLKSPFSPESSQSNNEMPSASFRKR